MRADLQAKLAIASVRAPVAISPLASALVEPAALPVVDPAALPVVDPASLVVATQLGDGERHRLRESLGVLPEGTTREVLGYKLRNGDEIVDGAVLANIPGILTGEVSVCGLKDFMIDSVIKFTLPSGESKIINCAFIAALDITDSPVHWHAMTTETYQILEGEGYMVLGEKVFEVKPGDVITLVPGIEHGLVSKNGKPVKVLLTFFPGLAPKSEPKFRDEAISYEKASLRAKELCPSLPI
ncbi:MAG: hypothetical protein A3B68_09095 [Candidatus Melainabacteria bacterium RIFCSPHIGHO2_02_FULL_34_12]|nr:MAG: hypothetical protein A3B68_09095 [Candidatus Melainabacteria bacterium RIFCSPHIGHO2_02_FULL_34_12]